MSTPAGGQRPDGRIDSAPENLRDTTRTQNVAGEAVVPAGKKPQTNATDEVSISTEINRLKNLDAKSFDKGYYEHAVANHKQLTALLEEAGNSLDSQIKAFSKAFPFPVKQNIYFRPGSSQND
ncbi:DUF4142 domain-containing protein [Pedobacter sp.]|uniref:DUF4142 domain-containing protein n=1 Tax=Pedobacter sp. TaxID=1411316 RepID=UPI003BAA6E36